MLGGFGPRPAAAPPKNRCRISGHDLANDSLICSRCGFDAFAALERRPVFNDGPWFSAEGEVTFERWKEICGAGVDEGGWPLRDAGAPEEDGARVPFPFPPLPPFGSPEAKAIQQRALGKDYISPDNVLVRRLKRTR